MTFNEEGDLAITEGGTKEPDDLVVAWAHATVWLQKMCEALWAIFIVLILVFVGLVGVIWSYQTQERVEIVCGENVQCHQP